MVARDTTSPEEPFSRSQNSRELDSLAIGGAWNRADEDITRSWGTRPKRAAAQGIKQYCLTQYSSFEDAPGAFASPSTSSSLTKPPRPQRKVGVPTKLMIQSPEKVTAADASDASSELSSLDSLFESGLYDSDTGEGEMDVQNKANNEKKRQRTSSPSPAARKKSTSGKPKKKSTLPREPKELNIIEIDGRNYLMQDKGCLSYHDSSLQLCRHCCARQAGDTCRFLQIRAFPIKVEEEGIRWLGNKGASSETEHAPIFINDTTRNERAYLPNHYDLNRAMDEDSKREIMTTAAVSLIGIFSRALLHAKEPNCIRRSRELQIRAMCDFCSTGIFASSYMCTLCGGEYCLACKEEMDVFTEKTTSQNQLFGCVKKRLAEKKHRWYHSARDLIPVTRFSIEEIEKEVKVMQELTQNGKVQPASTLEECGEGREIVRAEETCVKEGDVGLLSEGGREEKKEEGEVIVPSHTLTVEEKSTLDQETFLATWSKGEPLVVTNNLTRNNWDPNAFIDRYGDMHCEIVRCDAQAPFMTKAKYLTRLKQNPSYFWTWAKQVRVGAFFETFGKSSEERLELMGKGVWKLKDWPPAAEFSTFFPDIYEDFNYSVPMPDFTRRDGCKNLSSLFPKNANGPDLGPKMYNAWKGEHSRGKKGTTCLHMDIADAVNIMLYTADMEAHEQAAQWDIFRAEDANAIREFLVEKYPRIMNFGDPIHAQVHYLDDEAIKQLYQEKGVYSWRILQRFGEAVFIPAGCAHQVCNLTDCIKVAVDFISPQNVARCFQLTEEFRGLSIEGSKSWKEDVLQLKAQLWYAWVACRGIGEAPSKEEYEEKMGKRRKAAEAAKRAEEKRIERDLLYLQKQEEKKKKRLALEGEVSTGNDEEGVEIPGDEQKESSNDQLKENLDAVEEEGILIVKSDGTTQEMAKGNIDKVEQGESAETTSEKDLALINDIIGGDVQQQDAVEDVKAAKGVNIDAMEEDLFEEQKTQSYDSKGTIYETPPR